MKVTAIIPDDLIKEVKKLTGAKNITESLLKALQDWVALEKIKRLNENIKKKPLEFIEGIKAEELRELNRH